MVYSIQQPVGQGRSRSHGEALRAYRPFFWPKRHQTPWHAYKKTMAHMCAKFHGLKLCPYRAAPGIVISYQKTRFGLKSGHENACRALEMTETLRHACSCAQTGCSSCISCWCLYEPACAAARLAFAYRLVESGLTSKHPHPDARPPVAALLGKIVLTETAQGRNAGMQNLGKGASPEEEGR